ERHRGAAYASRSTIARNRDRSALFAPGEPEADGPAQNCETQAKQRMKGPFKARNQVDSFRPQMLELLVVQIWVRNRCEYRFGSIGMNPIPRGGTEFRYEK